MFLPFATSRRSTLLLAGILVISLFTWVGCSNGASESDEASEEESGPAYTIGDEIADSTIAVILESEYGTDTVQTSRFMSHTQMATQSVPPQRRAMISDSLIHSSVLDQLITQHVVTGAAKADGYVADSAAIAQRFEATKQRFTDEDGNLDEQAFADALAAENLSPERLREMIATQLTMQRQRQEIMKNAESPSKDSIEAVSERNRRFQAQHILIQVSDTAADAKVDSARQLASALIDSVESGVSFDSLAKRHSDGPSSTRGGRLPPTPRQRLAEPFADAALALNDSTEVTQEPVRTQFGFHVIRLLDRGEPADTARVRQALEQQKQRQAFQDRVEELRGSSELVVRVNPTVVKANLDE
ncbi:hypothetical protein CRI94_14505 [Longibacter salinarum]|uniref:PpiC domain-containing protein n=1 Tax=Longibacter salinarum TaxID=1850348 RepID=A0A2A8CUW2_9BACT|nr:peptidylprolyl isomerase [Longibacter salinarum]PEN12247.1 hypothetical protein CRI94_14505 [Longibacter salinarum]